MFSSFLVILHVNNFLPEKGLRLVSGNLSQVTRLEQDLEEEDRQGAWEQGMGLAHFGGINC